jgi:hypothetical protein
MKVLFFAILISTSIFAAPSYIADFPQGPIETLTPGSLCDRPDAYRYGERIPYCNRDALDVTIKEDVFREYRNIGYRLDPKDRINYKIDHLVPLCAGGSNQENNLWPQHVSIYTKTDSIESLGCEKLRMGKIKQADLVRRILSAKKNLSLVQSTLNYLGKL